MNAPIVKADAGPWGKVVLVGEQRLCAYCDCAVYLAKNGTRECCWCGTTYVVVDGEPVRTGTCTRFDGSDSSEAAGGK